MSYTYVTFDYEFYKYVTIKDLFSFLEQNQNIWDSRYLEKNILGKEPDWLKEKRKTKLRVKINRRTPALDHSDVC